jgi:hypothetical protein
LVFFASGMAPPFRQRQDDSQPFIDNLVNLMLTWRCPRQFQSKRSERSPDGAERNPGRHRRLVAIPDYAPLHPGYAFDCSGKNRLLRIFSAVSDRFSVLVASFVGIAAIQCFTATKPPHQ